MKSEQRWFTLDFFPITLDNILCEMHLWCERVRSWWCMLTGVKWHAVLLSEVSSFWLYFKAYSIFLFWLFHQKETLRDHSKFYTVPVMCTGGCFPLLLVSFIHETNVILVPNIRVYALKQTTRPYTPAKPGWSTVMSTHLLYTDISVGTNRNIVRLYRKQMAASAVHRCHSNVLAMFFANTCVCFPLLQDATKIP